MLKMLQNFLIDQGLSVGMANLLITIIGIIVFTLAFISYFENKNKIKKKKKRK